MSAQRWAGSPVLVTGAGGFIGSHLVRRLVAIGAEVHALVRRSGSAPRLDGISARVTEWPGDVRDYGSLLDCCRGALPSVVMHLAGDTSVRLDGGWEAVERSLDVNLRGTLNVLRAAQESGAPVAAFVRAGGLEEYGTAATPYDEAQRERPASPYAASQVAATHYCQVLQRHTAATIVTLRPALVYGPDQSTDFFIPSLIVSCLDGVDFEMTEGDQCRDLLYVDDLVDAFLLAASRPGLSGAVINLGHGEEHRILDVAQEIVRLAGKATRLHVGAKAGRAGDLEHLVPRAERAAALLGWRPSVGLAEGLERTVAWYRDRGSRTP